MRLISEDLYQRLMAKLANLPWREVNTLLGDLHKAPQVERKS